MQAQKKAVLTLQDGKTFEGYSFGYDGPTAGEVVFNTAMTGYPESLTDPSYEGQILITTFPQLGNYGVPPAGGADTLEGYYEGKRIHCRAIIAQDYAFHHSHWLADRSLAQWLNEEKIPGIYGIDTRALTKHLRQYGSMLGKITIEGGDDVDFYDPNAENNTRWVNMSVKAFGNVCERIKKMSLKESSFINIEGRLDEDIWTDPNTHEQKSQFVIILDDVEYASSGDGSKSKNGQNQNANAQAAPAPQGDPAPQAEPANAPAGNGFTGYEPFGSGDGFFDEG